VWVEGAERGDALVATIEEIVVDDSPGSRSGPAAGRSAESARWLTLLAVHDEDLPPHAGPERHHPRQDPPTSASASLADHALHRHARRRPRPRGPTSLDSQGEWGGTWTSATWRRATASGPVFHPGALLYLGDVHASQGDTEFTGTAAETKATVRLRLEVVKAKRIPWMRIEKPASIVSVYAYRPLEVAVETATLNLMEWLIAEFGFTPTDAYCLVSTCPEFRINVYQMCRLGKLSYVAGAELPRKYL
jgi:acetamidase/formamidase